jgi:aspartate-semialdehyde dehydrogenase
VPYIAKEEEKMEAEAKKLLGSLKRTKITPADFAISAQCNRVPVEEGHTESVAVKFGKKTSAEQLVRAFSDFPSKIAGLNLPTAPKQPVFYDPVPDRPQPRLDIMRGGGMTATVGRMRPCNVLDWKFTVLSHNTIRGAAGAAILNAELLKVKGYLD